MKKVKSYRFKEYNKGREKSYTTHKVNVLIEKKLNKAFKGKIKRELEIHTCEKMDVSESEESIQ